MNYQLSDYKTSMMNFPGLHDNCATNEHKMPDGSCMSGKEHPGAAVKEKAPAKVPKEKAPPKVLNLGKTKK